MNASKNGDAYWVVSRLLILAGNIDGPPGPWVGSCLPCSRSDPWLNRSISITSTEQPRPRSGADWIWRLRKNQQSQENIGGVKPNQCQFDTINALRERKLSLFRQTTLCTQEWVQL